MMWHWFKIVQNMDLITIQRTSYKYYNYYYYYYRLLIVITILILLADFKLVIVSQNSLFIITYIMVFTIEQTTDCI